MNHYLEKMLLDHGPISQINYGIVPVHDNPYPPAGNKGIHWETGIILKNFVQAKRPANIVELGTFRGYSTSWLILGTLLNGTGRVDAYEVFPEGHYGPMLYDHYGLPKDRFTYHEIPGGIWNFPSLIPEPIDLLYHDTEHLPGPTKREMELLLPRISVGGLVIVDDMLSPHYRPMQEYFNTLFGGPAPDRLFQNVDDMLKWQKDNLTWKWNILPIGCGLGIAERLK